MNLKKSDTKPCQGTCNYCAAVAPLIEAPHCTCSCEMHARGCPKGPQGEEGLPGAAVVEICHRLLAGVHECEEGRHGEVCTKTQTAIIEAMKLGRGQRDKLLCRICFTSVEPAKDPDVDVLLTLRKLVSEVERLTSHIETLSAEVKLIAAKGVKLSFEECAHPQIFWTPYYEYHYRCTLCGAMSPRYGLTPNFKPYS